MISSFKKQLKGAAILGALLMGSNAFAQLGLTWSEMGPNDIAGRCRSIIVDKTDPSGNKMFAAGVSGGVFKSTNAGATWSPVNDQAPSLIVSCMDQDNNGNIYYGTGEGFSIIDGAGSSGFLGSGLFKITPSSTVITQLKDETFFGDIYEVAVDGPNVYVASDFGFFISNDGGVNFTEEAISSSTPAAAFDVKLSSNGDIYYTSFTGTVSNVYKCPFGSTTFSNITPTVITNRGRIEIACSSVDPNYIYLSIAKTTGELSAVMGSNDKGNTWTTITLGTTQFDPFQGHGGNYSNTIVADPLKKDAFYLGAYLFYRWNQNTSGSFGQGTWTEVSIPFNIPFAVYVHPYVHDIKFNGGNNSMYIATDGGIFKSVSNNTGFLAYSSGLNISQFYSVAVPTFPRTDPGSPSNVQIPRAGAAGGSVGNDLTYISGSNPSNPQASTSFGVSNAYQSDFSKISPSSAFYSTEYGGLFRTNDVNSTTPPSTFYDVSYKLSGNGSPGSPTFANENTPMRLWENYTGMDSMLFYNEIAKVVGANSSSTKTSFTVTSSRPQLSSRYDSILVKAASTRVTPSSFSVTSTFTSNNSTATTFTFANTRSNLTVKYDSIVITAKSNKLLSPPANQTIKMKVLGYLGSMPATYTVIGAANTPTTNNMIFANTNLNDSIRFTFNTPPNDSTTFYVRIKYKYFQNIIILPVYTGTTITSCNVIGDANTSSASNNTVFVNSNQVDSIRYKFAVSPDSSSLTTTIKFKYLPGDVISVVNTDISGGTFTTTATLTKTLTSSTNPWAATIKLPLAKSARLAVGTNGKSITEGPNIWMTKRPLNFSVNPDWIKLAGKNSRIDGPGGVPSNTTAPMLVAVPNSTTSVAASVTRLEWSPSGHYIYCVVKEVVTTTVSSVINRNSNWYVYRVSHLELVADSMSDDYGGVFASDVDTGTVQRKLNNIRTTCLGKFTYPVTGIAIMPNDSIVMLTLGGYFNSTGTVYSSNGHAGKLSQNTIDATNWIQKNGTGLPNLPVYTGIFEMTDNKRAIIGTESGIYSTMDITQASPVWVKETGGNFPNVPVFQIRQQTMESYKCYNSGVIYVATHGRGIWSTDKFFTPYAIGIEEQSNNLSFNTNMRLFPNPASNNTNVWFKAAGDANYNITVYDINGRTLIQQTTGKLMEGEQTIQLNTSELNSGIYFVSLSGTNNFNANTKLVITR